MIITAGESRFDVDAIVFDKDGTLIDLFASWSPGGRAWVEAATDGDSDLAAALGEAIGVRGGEVVPNGILATGTIGQLQDVTRSLLARHGIADMGERLTRALGEAYRVANDHFTPIGDVSGTIRRLAAAGVGVGVVTADDRKAAQEALDRLGISHLVGVIVAGDDGVSPKPSPEPLRLAASALGVAVERVLYVGDSSVDREAARSAPTAGFVMVGGDHVEGDATVTSIDQLEVENV